MFRNYLLTGFRNLRKQFSYSIINIAGLACGLATCILLITWIVHEVSYDTFHSKAERIYRPCLEYGYGGQTARTAVSPTALLPTVLEFPEVETGVRVYNASGSNPYIVQKGDDRFHENRFYVADSTFFDVFSYRLLQGSAQTALAQPFSLILTERTARKYFGSEDPVGKTLLINGAREYTVTGVLEDIPANSFLQFDFLGSFSSLRAAQEPPIWWSANYQTFVVINPGADVSELERKTNEAVAEAVGQEMRGQGDYVRYNFPRLIDLHLRSTFDGEPEVVSDIKYVYIFSAIAALVLIIAGINYVNLATARAAERAREVSIRKVVGAFKRQLFIQFIGESFIITLFSFVLAWFAAQLLLPFFNQMAGKTFTFDHFTRPEFIVVAFTGLVVVTILAGAYPAFAMTSFKPATVLKGSFKASGRGVWLRRTLVVFQFSVSVVLIAGTLVITRQLNFIQERKLGYDRQNTITFPLDRQTAKVFDALKTELTRQGLAEFVGRGTESPVNIKGGYTIQSTETNAQGIAITGLLVDEEYIPAMGIEILNGRNFTREDRERVERDTVYTFMLNEAALKALAIDPASAIGTTIDMGYRKGELIGIVRDFHFASLHKPISPLVIFPEEMQFSKVVVRLPKGNVRQHLEGIKQVYASLIEHRPFEYEFIDDEFRSLYTNEQRLSSVFAVFASLAIFVAALGLLGLVAFSASQKTKEIGIRKVLGATAANIVGLITSDFAKLIIIAMIIGLPVSWWLMSNWLDGFAYRTQIGAYPLLIASGACILIALVSAGYQAVKAALVNPATTLRNE